MKRLLITGAAGGLGRTMRHRLAHMADIIRLSDIAEIDAPGPNEEVMRCDLADADAVMRLVEGCDAIVHFGGVSLESPFQTILNGNIIGAYNIYEAARAHGCPRILLASSNHVVGFYPQDKHLTATDPMKPDSLYGVSKCFGEALASLYHDKFGQETAIIRIGSCFEKATNRRMLATWLGADDFAALIERIFAVPKLGLPIIWGVSDNEQVWWNNDAIGWLGWQPKESSAQFRAEVEATPMPPKDDPTVLWQGGGFCAEPIHKDDKK